MSLLLRVMKKAYILKKENNNTTISLGFGNNVQNENDATYDVAVNNFSTAFNANATVFSNLTELNSIM